MKARAASEEQSYSEHAAAHRKEERYRQTYVTSAGTVEASPVCRSELPVHAACASPPVSIRRRATAGKKRRLLSTTYRWRVAGGIHSHPLRGNPKLRSTPQKRPTGTVYR